MTIPNPKWYHSIKLRRSRRQFNGQPISQTDSRYLLDFIEELNSVVEGFRAVLVTENPDEVFRGAVGNYGKVKNAPAYLAFISDISDPNVQVNTGYLGECLILEATRLGLSTCWIGGFFNLDSIKNSIYLLPNEKVLSVTPVGYTEKSYTFEEKLMSGFARSHKRKNLTSLCKGLPQKQWPEWVRSALEVGRLAPSAVNRQPWRFLITEKSITVSIDSSKMEFGISKRLDCGIAMLHIEVGALNAGVQGKWEYLQDPDVARFSI